MLPNLCPVLPALQRTSSGSSGYIFGGHTAAPLANGNGPHIVPRRQSSGQSEAGPHQSGPYAAVSGNGAVAHQAGPHACCGAGSGREAVAHQTGPYAAVSGNHRAVSGSNGAVAHQAAPNQAMGGQGGHMQALPGQWVVVQAPQPLTSSLPQYLLPAPGTLTMGVGGLPVPVMQQ